MFMKKTMKSKKLDREDLKEMKAGTYSAQEEAAEDSKLKRKSFKPSKHFNKSGTSPMVTKGGAMTGKKKKKIKQLKTLKVPGEKQFKTLNVKGPKQMFTQNVSKPAQMKSLIKPNFNQMKTQDYDDKDIMRRLKKVTGSRGR